MSQGIGIQHTYTALRNKPAFVECLNFVRRVAGSILGRLRSEDIFLRLLHL